MGRLKDAQLFFFFFFKIKNCFKKTPFYIIIFYVMNVISFLSYAAVTFLSLTFKSCHRTLPFHSPAQVQPHDSTTAQQSMGKQCRGQQFRQDHIPHHGQVAQENMGHWRGHLFGTFNRVWHTHWQHEIKMNASMCRLRTISVSDKYIHYQLPDSFWTA